MNLNKIYKALSVANDIKAVSKGRFLERLFNKWLFKSVGKFKK